MSSIVRIKLGIILEMKILNRVLTIRKLEFREKGKHAMVKRFSGPKREREKEKTKKRVNRRKDADEESKSSEDR